MSIVVVSGSAGLVGSEAAMFFAKKGMQVIGIDNDMRAAFFGGDASTRWQRRRLQDELASNYQHADADIRDWDLISEIFRKNGSAISLVIHAAAQPSHDWAAGDPRTDFAVNANGTLNLLEATRKNAPEAVFVFLSTNKVYGDSPNRLPFIEEDSRFEIDSKHAYYGGINEGLPIDQSLHSIFGASKVAADILVQEYGRYFGMQTVCFRGGCFTGPGHEGVQLHGFLSFLMRCVATGKTYTVFGYKGKQVRDNIYSTDLIHAIFEFFKKPRIAEVYNIGGGRFSNCSVLEAIELSQSISGRELRWDYSPKNRIGDHKWWISDNSKFMKHYPDWKPHYSVKRILAAIYDSNSKRWTKAVS